MVVGARPRDIVTAEGHAVDPMGVAPEGPDEPPVRGVKDVDCAVSAARVDPPVAAPLDALDALGVAAERVDAGPAGDVPDARRPVLGRAHEPLPDVLGACQRRVRLPRQGRDEEAVAAQRLDEGARVGVPDLDLAVLAAGGQEPAVRRPRDAEHPVAVPRARPVGRHGGEVPEAHGHVAAAARQALAVGRELDAHDRVGVPHEGPAAPRHGVHAEHGLGRVHDLERLLGADRALAPLADQRLHDLLPVHVEAVGKGLLVGEKLVDQLLELRDGRVGGKLDLRALRLAVLGAHELRDDVGYFRVVGSAHYFFFSFLIGLKYLFIFFLFCFVFNLI